MIPKNFISIIGIGLFYFNQQKWFSVWRRKQEGSPKAQSTIYVEAPARPLHWATLGPCKACMRSGNFQGLYHSFLGVRCMCCALQHSPNTKIRPVKCRGDYKCHPSKVNSCSLWTNKGKRVFGGEKPSYGPQPMTIMFTV